MAGAKKRAQKQHRAGHGEPKSLNSSSSEGLSSSTSNNIPITNLDGNRDPAAAPAQNLQPAAGPLAAFNKNLDLGARAAQVCIRGTAIVGLPERPKTTNKTGREVVVKLNTFAVTEYPVKPIYQYDVMVGKGGETRGLIKKLWNSKAAKEVLKSASWLFDGNKLAWSLEKKDEIRISVDLDKEQDKQPRIDRKTGQPKQDIHTIHIKLAKQVAFDTLRAYLQRQCDFDNNVLEAINFLDHLLREKPSQELTSIKRCFFARGEKRTILGGGAEAFKGVYASVRMVNLGLGVPATLSVNVDVANGTFWTEGSIVHSAVALTQSRDVASLINALKAGRDSPSGQALNKMKRLHVYVKHLATVGTPREFCIDYFEFRSAKEGTFMKLNQETGVESKISYYDYYLKEYKVRLQYPELPLIHMTAGKGKIVYPMELCYIPTNQRYNSKLNEKQTSEMIKFAVTLPAERWGSVEHGLKMLDWPSDRYMANYGMKISTTATQVKGRLLPNPKVNFSNNASIDPRTSGRWDLRGKKFLEPHPTPLKSWGVCVIKGRFSATQEQVQNFFQTFVSVFQGHGGKVASVTPYITSAATLGESMADLYMATGNQFQMKPQILFFIVPDKDSVTYQRIKKSADCRFGIVSQVLQSSHVQKAQSQYCSNVAMKVNAKLGGSTARALGLKGPGGWFTKPTMIIGADVSHSAPGIVGASLSAVTVSWDRHAIKYAATVETNGHRVEMIQSDTMQRNVLPLVRRWTQVVGGGRTPQHVLYFRDGVSEGQYTQVLQTEVHDLRKMMKEVDPKTNPLFTVVVASKRHHIRFFPAPGSADKNGNAQPGTLIETGVTHPFEYDFYLCAHNALKGTARPIHYHVLLDEAKMGVEELQNMIYESSYQYVRSTTPVSLFPAVYYAHLASNRGLCHVDQPFKPEGGRSGGHTGSSGPGIEVADIKPVLPMPEAMGIRETMWYI